jgi:hypothetical protein
VKTLLPADAGRFSDALRAAFPTVHEIEKLLVSGTLERDFDDLTSRSVSLKANTDEICRIAIQEGWGITLFEVARTVQPDSPALRALWDALEDLDPSRMATAPILTDRPSLTCGRGVQWNQVCQVGPARQHALMLIAGGQGQDPEHFQERIRVFLAPTPPRSILQVGWPTRPASREEFFECLSTAVKPGRASLKDAIALRLRSENVMLLHDCVDVRFEDDNLIKYYTEWLPELLEGQAHHGRLKCVQPIEWHEEAGLGFIQRLLSGRRPGANDREGALSLITALEKKAPSAAIQAIRLPELSDLTDEELQTFLSNCLTVPQQKQMMNELRAVPQVPEMIFKTIDACWNRVTEA